MKKSDVSYKVALLLLLGFLFLLYPFFSVILGVAGSAVFALLTGCLLRSLLAGFPLTPRRYLTVGILLAAGCIVGADVAYGLLFHFIGVRDNVFFAEIALLWMTGYLCFAAIPFLFSKSVRSFRLPLALAVAATGAVLLVIEPFYWGEFEEDVGWSPRKLIYNHPVPIWNYGKPSVRLAAPVSDGFITVIGWDGLETLPAWGSNDFLPELLLPEGDSGFQGVTTEYGGDQVSIQIAPGPKNAGASAVTVTIPARTLYPDFSKEAMKIAYFNCYANSEAAPRGEIRLTWRLRLLKLPQEKGQPEDAIIVVCDLLLDPATRTVAVEPGRVFPFAPIRVGVADGTAWAAWRSPRSLDVMVSCRPGTVWSKPERLTGGVAWEFPFRGVTAAGNRKVHFIWEDERNSFQHFLLARRPDNADLYYRNFNTETMRWSGERKLSAGCKYIVASAVAAEKDTVAVAWIGTRNDDYRTLPRRLFYTVSFDGGRNWEKTRVIPGTVSADALELHLQNGTLHLFYGRRIGSENKLRYLFFYRRRALAEFRR